MRRRSTVKDKFGNSQSHFDPGMSVVNEEIKEEINDTETEWEKKLNDIDDDASEALNMNYDVIDNAREDSPYYQACWQSLNNYKQKAGEDAEDLDIDQAAKSKQMLAIDVDIYINNQCRKGVLVITQGILILLYKGTKACVMPSFSINDVKTLFMSENLPSAAALELDAKAQSWSGRSHLIIESPSMGLFMRYILVMSFTTEIDFCTQVKITEDDKVFDFEFEHLNELKNVARDSFSNGVVRSTRKIRVWQLKENTFSANNWFARTAVITNIGIFMFEHPNARTPPVKPGEGSAQFWPWLNFNTVQMRKSNEVVEGNLVTDKGQATKLKKGNLFVLSDKDGIEMTFAAAQRELMTDFVRETKRMNEYFKKSHSELLEGNILFDQFTS